MYEYENKKCSLFVLYGNETRGCVGAVQKDVELMRSLHVRREPTFVNRIIIYIICMKR